MGITVKNRYSSQNIPWSEINSVSMICINEEWRFQAKTDKNVVTLPFTIYIEKIEELLLRYSELIEVNTTTVGLVRIKRWSKKGICYQHTSSLDKINDVLYK